MLLCGRSYQPVKATVLKGGAFTAFGVPMFKRDKASNRDVPMGFVNVLVQGEYDFHRGDSIKILEITGVNVKDSKYFTAFARIEYIPLMEQKAEPNRDVLANNIPDDLF